MNDNVFKFAFTLLVTYQAAQYSSLDTAVLVNLIAGLFILPFILFSATSGQLADRYDKASLVRAIKALEVAIMLVGCWGFFAHSAAVLLLTTFLLGLHSTLFGPVKYAYLPAHLLASEIVGGNGLVEMGTFVAILLGTIAGGQLVDSGPGGPMAAGWVTVAVALVGLAASWFVPKTPPADAGLKINWNPFTETWRNLAIARTDRAVFLSLLGISWLWFFGATFLTQFSTFARDVLGGDGSVVTVLLAVFSIGIAVGSLLCERLSGHKIEIGLVPFGSIGMTVFGIDLYWASHGLHPAGVADIGTFMAEHRHWRVLVDLFLLAMFSGFYSVPLYALIQTRCQPTHRSRIIAANNILNAIFMIASAIIAIALLRGFDFSIPQLFLASALFNAVVAIYIYSLVPEFLYRFLAWLLIHTMYRVRKSGLQNIPDHGPALIVSNHVSFVDALLIMGCSPRPIRFVMDRSIFSIPVLSWLFRQAKAIPIGSYKEDPRLVEAAFEAVSAELRDGQLVCIFPEGRITDTGDIVPFRPGISRILERNPVPVVPVALQGLWGSFFSRAHGGRPFNGFRGFFSRIGIAVGAAVAPQVAAPAQLQTIVSELRGAWR